MKCAPTQIDIDIHPGHNLEYGDNVLARALARILFTRNDTDLIREDVTGLQIYHNISNSRVLKHIYTGPAGSNKLPIHSPNRR